MNPQRIGPIGWLVDLYRTDPKFAKLLFMVAILLAGLFSIPFLVMLGAC